MNNNAVVKHLETIIDKQSALISAQVDELEKKSSDDNLSDAEKLDAMRKQKDLAVQLTEIDKLRSSGPDPDKTLDSLGVMSKGPAGELMFDQLISKGVSAEDAADIIKKSLPDVEEKTPEKKEENDNSMNKEEEYKDKKEEGKEDNYADNVKEKGKRIFIPKEEDGEEKKGPLKNMGLNW